MGCETFDDEIAERAIGTWFAGFECELSDAFDTFGTPYEVDHLGLGMHPRTVKQTATQRYRDIPADIGIIGHRCTWAARALHLIILSGRHIMGGDRRYDSRVDILTRLAYRASAFCKERLPCPDDVDHELAAEAAATRQHALGFVASLTRTRRGRPPLLATIALAGPPELEVLDAASSILGPLNFVIKRITEIRRRKHAEDIRLWAKQASASALHDATKHKSPIVLKSASASKAHAGERTYQQAADNGAREWGSQWHATMTDTSEDIMQALEALECIDQLYPEVALPPSTPNGSGNPADPSRPPRDWVLTGLVRGTSRLPPRRLGPPLPASSW